MMNSINWSDFNGDKFQVFCNGLLSFELGKDFVPFSAPGGDQGIDGFFDGEYNGKKLKCRFQAKFHHPNTGRYPGYYQLKDQVKKDIEKNIQDENTIIFITNVELNPGQRKEIKNIAEKALKETHIEFDIWDGAKIDTLLAHHPIVNLWYTSQLNHLIQEYSECYHKELNETVNNIYDFSNKFYHRKDKLNILNEFISDNTKTVALISGEAGIGKTRLCVEFFKQYIDANNDWKALVIRLHKLDFKVLQKALTGEKNYVVLVDDADSFDAKDLADLLNIAKGIKENKVKLLLTVRCKFIEHVLRNINPADKNDIIKRIKLDKLTREETAQFLKSELTNDIIGEHLGYFVDITYGIPVVIMTLLRVIKNGRSPSDIKKDDFFKDYVKEYFKKNIELTNKDKEIKRRDIEKIISLFSLIEPIRIDDESLIQQIAATEKISYEDVEIILQSMKSQNIISGYHQYEIKPDIYSDLFLEEKLNSKSWLEEKLRYNGSYANNIIRNVGYAHQNKQDDNILQKLLEEHINQIDTCSDNQELTKILETVYVITYIKPLIAEETVKKTLSIYTNEQHPLNREFQDSLTQKKYSLDFSINNLKQIIYNLFQLEDYFLHAYKYSESLYQLTRDDGIISDISGFRKSDQFEGFNCERQNKILAESGKALNSNDKNRCLFAIRLLRFMLNLKFIRSNTYFYQIQSYTLIIPENKYVKKLRKETINSLIDFFNKTSFKAFKEEIVGIIVDVPRNILAVREKKIYKGNDEIKIVFNFLLSISNDNILELRHKKHIKDQLYWFKEWDIDSSFYEVIDKIKENLSKNDLAEQLMDLFNPGYDNLAGNKPYEINANALINKYSGVDLGNALVKVVAQIEYVPLQFYGFLDAITSDLSKTVRFISHLWDTNRSFVAQYCSNIFRKLRFSENYEKIYWEYIEKLSAENTEWARNCMFHVYNSRKIHDAFISQNNSKRFLKSKDANLIIELFQNSTVQNYYYIAPTLPTLFLFDKTLAKNQIEKFLENCNDQHLDSLFFGFDPIKEKNYPEIKELVLKKTIRINIQSHGLQSFLCEIIRKDGFQEVLNYIENRFLFMREYYLVNKSLLGYKYIPEHGYGITKGLSGEQKMKIFSMVINWFVQFDYKSHDKYFTKDTEKYFAIDMIELFKVQDTIDRDIKVVYEKLITKYKTNSEKLMNIALSLSEFKRKNEAYIDLVIEILKSAHQNIKEQDFERLTKQCFSSLISMCNTSAVTPGQPFSEDLELKELLEKALKRLQEKDLAIRKFFSKVIEIVQDDIDTERKRYYEVW